MKTRIRDSYTPKLGDYCNTLVIDKETGNQYLFDADGVWTLISTDEEGIVAEAVAQANAYTDDVAEGKVDKEEGKGLSENDFTDEDKEKLDDIEDGAQENVIEVIKRNGTVLPVTDKTVDIAVPTTTSSLTNDSGYITNEVDDLVNYYDKDETDTLIATEAETRDAADLNLQEQIDAISSASDVVDVVGTYAELQAYDTSKLGDNDIIKVLTDETHDNAISYYRWNDTTETFTYIGSQGPFYTKSETDATFVPQTRTINGKGLNSDVVLTAADVNALPASTVIPTVNDATLTIKKNGTTVTTFTANSAQNATADISVPTKVSDLTNDLDFVEETDLADVAFSGDYADLTGAPSIPTKTSDLTNDSNFVSDANYVHTDNNFTTTLKNKLNGIAAGAEVNVQSDWNVTDTTSDAFIKNKPSIPTKTSDLTNDSGFITSAALPTKTSDLTNDSGFITKNVSDLTNYYTQSEVNGMFNALSIPTKTSDLVNDSGFLTSIPIASASTLGGVKIGSGINVAADGTISAAVASLDWANITNKPTNVSYWTNDAGYITSAALPTKTSDLTNDSGFITSASLPTKTSDLTNDSGFITNSVNNLTNYYKKSETYSQSEVNSLLSAIAIPTKTSDLTNDGADGTAQYLENDETAYATASIPYGKVDNTSTATAFTATVPGITQLRQGVSFWLENGVVTSASGFTVNINNLGAKPVYNNLAAATRDTTIFNAAYTMLFVYDEDRVSGGAFICYRGYGANTNTIGYQLRTNSQTMPMTSITYRYRLLFTSADGEHYVPANNSSSTNATASRTVCQDPIDPFGPIFYYGTTASVAAGARPAAASLWQQYVLTLGYSFNRTGAALTLTSYKPVYVKAAPQSDGSAIIDADTPYVQDLPTTEDGKIYIFLGVAYSATNIELELDHPVYYYKDGAIRLWTNAATGISSVAWGDITGTLADQTDLNTALGAKANSADLATVATSGSYNDLTNKPTIPTVNNATLTIQKNNTNVATFTANAASNVTANISVPTVTSDLTNDSGFLTSSTLPVATSNSLGVVQVGSGLTVSSGGVLSATGGGVADSVAWGHITGTLADQTDLQDELDAKANTADLATVATSGSYNDLTNKPTIPTVNNATLTIQKNGTTVKTFTANASSNVTANITVPTTVAELSDASTYVTQNSLATQLVNKQNTLTAGDHINITGSTIKAVDYVHSDDPVSTTAVTPVVTNNMIADGTITADKLATGATVKLTLSTSDIGEGAALAANTLYGVYQ